MERTHVRDSQFSKQEMTIFLDGENYGRNVQPGPKSGGVFPTLPFESADLYFIPRSLGGPILWRQQFLLMYLNYLVEDILTLGSETRHKKVPERDVNAALVKAVSNLNIQPKALKSSLPEVCVQAMDSKAASEDYLLLIQTEPSVLDHAVNTASGLVQSSCLMIEAVYSQSSQTVTRAQLSSTLYCKQSNPSPYGTM